MPRIKVTMSEELKAALELVSKRLGMPLSQLLVSAAIDRYLHTTRPLPKDLAELCDRLASLEKNLSKLSQLTKPSANPIALPVKTSGQRKPRKGAETFMNQSHEPVISSLNGTTLSIFDLVIRFKGDRSLKARLCQLGGRDGRLFTGDISAARRVEEITSKLDPEKLPWMPLAPDRLSWLQIDSVSYCKKILNAE